MQICFDSGGAEFSDGLNSSNLTELVRNIIVNRASNIFPDNQVLKFLENNICKINIEGVIINNKDYSVINNKISKYLLQKQTFSTLFNLDSKRIEKIKYDLKNNLKLFNSDDTIPVELNYVPFIKLIRFFNKFDKLISYCINYIYLKLKTTDFNNKLLSIIKKEFISIFLNKSNSNCIETNNLNISAKALIDIINEIEVVENRKIIKLMILSMLKNYYGIILSDKEDYYTFIEFDLTNPKNLLDININTLSKLIIEQRINSKDSKNKSLQIEKLIKNFAPISNNITSILFNYMITYNFRFIKSVYLVQENIF